jgi:adenylate cyclase
MLSEGGPMTNPGASHNQRKLAAILAADVAGYSRLMGEDEVGTAQAVRQHLAAIFPIMTSHGGRVVKTTGDGVLLDFSSVVAAVECAATVQKLMTERNADVPQERRIVFRIGVNVGDVLVEAEDLVGDGVNIAARLEGIAEPGGICISDDAYRHVQGKVSAQLVDSGYHQLKNIARPVRVYHVLPQGIASAARPKLAVPDKPSIAVLPFDNRSGTSEDLYFADGIAEELIMELSRFPDLFVIARNSSFTYRGKAAPIPDVARELGVRYVLEGSVQRAGHRVRIGAELVDAASSKHLWAQHYDRTLEDLFAVQDEVARQIVGVLPARIEAAAFEYASRKLSSSLDAYDHMLHGKYCWHFVTPEANLEAESHFDHAIELDPRFARAHAWKACTLGQAWTNEFRPRASQLQQKIIQIIERATSLDPNDTECHRIQCRLALLQGHYEKSEHHLECALALNPNDPRLVIQRGENLIFLGDPEAALPWIERAMRLDPFSAHLYYLHMARALFMAKRPSEAIAVLERTARTHWQHYLWLAACHLARGDKAAAQQAAQQALALRPHLSVAAYVDGGAKWKRAEDRARLCDALAQAGLPP